MEEADRLNGGSRLGGFGISRSSEWRKGLTLVWTAYMVYTLIGLPTFCGSSRKVRVSHGVYSLRLTLLVSAQPCNRTNIIIVERSGGGDQFGKF